MKVLLGLLAISAVLFRGQAMPDPCIPGNYKELNDVRRSTGYRMLTDESGLCDIDLDPGWYRFTSGAGGMIPESCPRRTQCGTMVPVWMNGTHPTVADDIVDRQACAYFGTNGGSTPCCDHHIDIGVKNCGGNFFVYYLQSTPSCPVAYCAGTRAPCPAGHWSSNGFPPCHDAYPIIHTDPTFSGPIINQHSFHFACRVNYPNHDPNLKLEVQWTFDNGTGAGIPNMMLSEPEREARLPGTALTGNLNHLLRCRVRAWYANTAVVHKSPWRQSNESYFVGFRVEPGRVEVTDRTTEAKVEVTSTVPIVCDHSFTAACCISLNLDVDGPKNTVVVAHPCTYKLCSKDWDPVTHTASKEIILAARKNQIVDGSHPMFLAFEKLEAAGGGPYLNVFSNYTLPQVPVTVKQEAPLKCSWTGDPHITGFSKHRYHLFDAGDFTMYKNDKDNFEVQSRTYVCGRVACQCGLLIKEQNDVIHINNCVDMKHAPVIETSKPLREGTVIERSNDGKHIMVYLPSGREVKIDVGVYHGSMYQNTYLTVPASDKASGHGQGICGTPDSRTDNEFTYSNGTVGKPCTAAHCVPRHFEESWRHNSTDSLFHVLPPTTQPPTASPHFCQCDTGVTGAPRINCSVAADLSHNPRCSPCKPVPVSNLPAFLAKQAWATTKREAEATYVDRDEPDPRHVPGQRSIGDRWSQTWPTASGITETQARDHCQSVVQAAQLFGHCSTKTDLIKDAVTNCMLDVLFMDSYDMVEASAVAFTDGCQFDLMQDINNYHMDSQGTLVLKSHVTNVCATACLRHGRCVGGACVCNHGYTGSSCQLVAGHAPTLLRIRGSDKCDVDKQPCRKVFMDAEGFENSDHFQCKVQEVLSNGHLSTSNVLTQGAEFLTDGRLACPLPDAGLMSAHSSKTFAVSVTNDGSLYSNALHVIVFDSSVTDNLAAVSHVHLSGPDDDFLFTCSFHSTTQADNARFEVTWVVDGQQITGRMSLVMAGAAHAQYSVQISQEDLPSSGRNVTCRVRSLYHGQDAYGAYNISNSMTMPA